MKQTKHFLATIAMLLCSLAASAEAITNISQLSNTAVYHISTSRGTWTVAKGGNALKSNVDLGMEASSSDPCQQFAIVRNGSLNYLYHVAEDKFVNKDGSLSKEAVDPIYFSAGAYENTFLPYFDGSHYINLGGSSQMVINSWSTADAGNSCTILPVGEFDVEDLLSRTPLCVVVDGVTYFEFAEGEVEIFQGTDASGYVVIPSTITFQEKVYKVTKIGNDAFNDCGGLTSITIPASVTSIGNRAFYDCYGLTSITLPEGVTSIGNYAFSGCSNLRSITLPEGVTSIGNDAFYYCSSLRTITIPEGVTSIGDYAFYSCYNLTDIAIPESVASIGNGAFINCDGLTYIDIPASVTSIGNRAFDGCDELTYIDIPASVASIGNDAFDDCNSLTEVHISSIEAWCKISFSNPYSTPLKDERSNLYLNGELVTELVIPEGVTRIGDYAFYNYENLTSITLPEGVTSIGSEAFLGCWGLTSITLPEGVTSIGRSAFYNCAFLTSITIPESVTSIGNYAFAGCRLKSITIPEGVTSIGEGTFRGCSNLTSITIPEGVTSIGGAAFYNCSSLTSITLPESVMSIGNSAFSGCSGLTDVDVHVASVESWLANNLSSSLEHSYSLYLDGALLNCVEIPSSVASIPDHAFYNCMSLTSITIPEGVTEIGDYAFYNCRSLTSITIPEGMTSIGNNAFSGCSRLTSITCYAKTPPTCASSAFSDVYKQTPVYVPADSKTKYWYATGWEDFSNYQSIVMVTSIALNHTSAALYEGETLMLTANVSPESAFNLPLTWTSSDESVATVDAEGKVTTLSAGVATITATANDGSGVTASCEVTVNAKPEEQCAAPTIDYINGQVVLTCETEDVQFVTEAVIAEGTVRSSEAAFDLVPTYTITAYVTKEGWLDSEATTVTLCWIDCSEQHAGEGETGIINIPSRPVLIKTDGGVITLTGLTDGTAVAVYDTAGVGYGTAVAENGEVTIATTLEEGSTAIVKIGERSVKVLVK